MVEFALILPVLLLLALGIIEFGYRYAKASQLNNFAYIAARDVSINNAISADTTTKINNATSPAVATVTTTLCPVPAVAGSNSVVTITASLTSPTGGFFNWLPGSTAGHFSINAKGAARCDG